MAGNNNPQVTNKKVDVKPFDIDNIKAGYALTEENIEWLKKLKRMVSNTSFNAGGFTPINGGFRILIKDLKVCLLDACRQFIPDFYDVTIDHDKHTGMPHAYVWIASNSPHICDSSLKNQSNSLFKTNLIRYDVDIKKFIDRFGLKNQKRFFPGVNNRDFMSLELNLDAMFDLIFDRNGSQFAYEIGGRKKDCIVTERPYYGDEPRNFEDLKAIDVMKKLKDGVNTGKGDLIARHSGNMT
jgi:hypothetical protein